MTSRDTLMTDQTAMPLNHDGRLPSGEWPKLITRHLPQTGCTKSALPIVKR